MAKQSKRDNAPPSSKGSGSASGKGASGAQGGAEAEDDEPKNTSASKSAALPASKSASAKAGAKAAPPADEDDDEEASDEGDDEESSAADDEDDAGDEESGDESSEEDASDESESGEEGDLDEKAADGEDSPLATNLGLQRYVFSAYFTAAMLLAFVLAKTVHGLWSKYANRDFFANFAPRLAGVPDDDSVLSKSNYSFVIGGILAVLIIIRLYTRPSTKRWTNEVTSELAKVRWPTRKEVQNSTIVVITAALLSTAYLFLLDRLWAFLTGIIYGNGT